MSHFSVLVIRDPSLTLKEQLQPFHEYECTGVRDEYVVDVDITDEVIAEFGKPQRVVKLADGRALSRWDSALYTGQPKERWDRPHFVLPDGAEEIQMEAEEARALGIGYVDLAACATEYYGGFIREGRAYRLTNPNKKWDWWQVGGRYTGKFKLKAKALGVVGRPGLMTEEAPPGYADEARKGDIDLAQMREDAAVKARALWRSTRDITGGLGWDTWDDTRGRYSGDINRARDEYAAQPAIVLLKASGRREYSWEIDCELALDEEVYVQRRRDAALSSYAFLRGGIWTERGSMGWFGCASDEMTQAQWQDLFNRMIDQLPDDMLLTVVDCHI